MHAIVVFLIAKSPPKHSGPPTFLLAKFNLCNVAYLPLRLCLHFRPTAQERVPVTCAPLRSSGVWDFKRIYSIIICRAPENTTENCHFVAVFFSPFKPNLFDFKLGKFTKSQMRITLRNYKWNCYVFLKMSKVLMLKLVVVFSILQVNLKCEEVRRGNDKAARCKFLDKYLPWLAADWKGSTFKKFYLDVFT